jgi:serine phosphatase RsbU (regulator of sigma subunit)
MLHLFHSQGPDEPSSVEPIPTVFPHIQGVDIAAVFAGKRIAGDFYDSVRVSPERVLIGMLDVAGRRETNRGILSAAQQIFRNLGTELFSRPDINESEAMTELSLRINRGIIETSKGVRSCPAFIACYHEKFGTVCYTNAGHTPGLLRDSNGITNLASGGLPLGLFSHATSDAPTVGLEKGAILLLASRGVVDCEGHNSHSSGEFGLERVRELLQSAPNGTAQALCTHVLQTVGDFGGQSPLCDDRTALALVRTV